MRCNDHLAVSLATVQAKSSDRKRLRRQQASRSTMKTLPSDKSKLSSRASALFWPDEVPEVPVPGSLA